MPLPPPTAPADAGGASPGRGRATVRGRKVRNYKDVLTRKATGDAICEILEKKAVADDIDDKQGHARDTMKAFVKDFFEQKYGHLGFCVRVFRVVFFLPPAAQ